MQLFCNPLRPKKRACEGHTMHSTSGLAVLVHKSYTLLTHSVHMMVSDESDGQRAVQLLAVQSPWGTLGIANTHLTHLKSADELRRTQLHEVITALGSLSQCQYRFIAGDMNMVVDRELLDSQRCAADMTLLDCYTQGGGGADDSTLIAARRAGESNRRIDYILSLAPPNHHPVCSGAELIGLDPVTAWGERPSDHAGVVVKLYPHKGEVAAVVDPDE
jgi:endonuclease/exonuclease/phosphatase family metal-dependent hydrolase